MTKYRVPITPHKNATKKLTPGEIFQRNALENAAIDTMTSRIR